MKLKDFVKAQKTQSTLNPHNPIKSTPTQNQPTPSSNKTPIWSHKITR